MVKGGAEGRSEPPLILALLPELSIIYASLRNVCMRGSH